MNRDIIHAPKDVPERAAHGIGLGLAASLLMIAVAVAVFAVGVMVGASAVHRFSKVNQETELGSSFRSSNGGRQ